MQIIPVILAGGYGERLWPRSRRKSPKQFLEMAGDASLFRAALKRIASFTDTPPLVIANEEHRFLVAEQLRLEQKLRANIILEPCSRNTAPALTMAALNSKPEDVLIVLAADHVIKDSIAFNKALKQAVSFAQKEVIVTLGITPDRAETAYGYIKKGKTLEDGAVQVERFVEKPQASLAEQYYQSKEYFWNSGMFIFKAGVYLSELKRLRPDILDACREVFSKSSFNGDFMLLDKESFSAVPSISIDYAVMEHTDKAVCVPLNAGWSDCGSWPALWQITDKDAQGNALKGDVIIIDSKNNYISTDKALVAAVGVENLVIVQSEDALLVASKDRAQDIKKLIETLKTNKRKEL